MNSGLWKNGTIHLLLNTRAIYHITVLFSNLLANQPTLWKKNPSLFQPFTPSFFLEGGWNMVDFPSDLFAYNLRPVAPGRLCSDVPTFVQYREARFARSLGDGGRIGGCRVGDLFLGRSCFLFWLLTYVNGHDYTSCMLYCSFLG